MLSAGVYFLRDLMRDDRGAQRASIMP
jgi:hypothetical protein